MVTLLLVFWFGKRVPAGDVHAGDSQTITVDASSIRAPRASPRIILSEQRMFFMLGPKSGKTDLNAKLRKSEHINVDRNPGVARISPVLSDRSVLHWGCGGGN